MILWYKLISMSWQKDGGLWILCFSLLQKNSFSLSVWQLMQIVSQIVSNYNTYGMVQLMSTKKGSTIAMHLGLALCRGKALECSAVEVYFITFMNTGLCFSKKNLITIFLTFNIVCESEKFWILNGISLVLLDIILVWIEHQMHFLPN